MEQKTTIQSRPSSGIQALEPFVTAFNKEELLLIMPLIAGSDWMPFLSGYLNRDITC